MGSAIGDYIHFHSQRYAAFGIERGSGQTMEKGPGNGYEEGTKIFTQYISNRKTFFKKQKNSFKINTDKNKQFLENIKDLMDAWDMSAKEAKKKYKEGIYEGVQIVKEILKQEFGKLAEKDLKMVAGTFDSQTKKSDANLSNQLRVLINGIEKIDVNKTYHYAYTVSRTLEDLRAAIKMVAEQGSMKDEEIEKLKKQVNDFRHHLVDVDRMAESIKDIIKWDKKLGDNKSRVGNKFGHYSKYNKGNRIYTEGYGKKFFEDINEVIGKLKGVQGIRKKYVGQSFESVGTIAKLMSEGIGQKEFAEMLKKIKKGAKGKDLLKGWSGSNQSPFRVTTSFADFLNPQEIITADTYKFQNTSGNWTISAEGSQDKIDIRAFFNEGSPLFISAKNYHIGKKGGGIREKVQIHLVKKSPLLIMLLGATTPDFINHFLNITAIHYDKDKDNAKVTTAKEEAKKAIQLMMLDVALRGYRGNDRANVFLINDATTGTIRMLSTADLIYSIVDKIQTRISPSSWQQYFWIEGGLPELQNEWIEAEGKTKKDKGKNDTKKAEERIKKLLAQAYSYKVTAGIYSGALNLVENNTLSRT